jgi:hypothetical protein
MLKEKRKTKRVKLGSNRGGGGGEMRKRRVHGGVKRAEMD